jgi:acetolactate synthase-1/2/3 large subunit
MNGADSLLATLAAAGVDVCFANPGTSEMHFMAALGQQRTMRGVLGLFEGVVSGMADGYGRMTGKPAVTLLHLGPGLSNASANLHNARRAGTPVVNVVGDHATAHLRFDAPLASDIVGLARPVSHWVHTITSSRNVAADAARAVQAARQPPGQIATLILPADAAWEPAAGPATPLPVPTAAPVSDDTVERIAQVMRSGRRVAMLLRGDCLMGDGLVAAGRVRADTGVRLLSDTFAPRTERGAGRVRVEKLPYFAEQLVTALSEVDVLVLVGSKPPVSFFAYPDKPSWGLRDDTEVVTLAHPHEDATAALSALAERLGAPAQPAGVADFVMAPMPTDRLNQFTIGEVIGRFLPEGAIISEEAATNSLGPYAATVDAAPHDYLTLTGGSIGQAVPVAAGAAVACPDRKVVCLQGDGGAMYTLQTLWTMAREQLDVTTVIFANRSYGILRVELDRVGAVPSEATLAMFDLRRPDLDWVCLAEGMGVEAVRVDTIEAFADVFASAMATPGPRLIEVVM